MGERVEGVCIEHGVCVGTFLRLINKFDFSSSLHSAPLCSQLALHHYHEREKEVRVRSMKSSVLYAVCVNL
jgi:hypothetical protein